MCVCVLIHTHTHAHTTSEKPLLLSFNFIPDGSEIFQIEAVKCEADSVWNLGHLASLYIIPSF